MGPPLRDRYLHTYGEYLTWPDEPRYELLDGHAYTMAPAPSRWHQQVVGELFRGRSRTFDGDLRRCRTGGSALPGRHRPGGEQCASAVVSGAQPLDLSIEAVR